MDVFRPVLMTLILHFLTSHPLKRTLILAKSLTSDPYNRGFLKKEKECMKYVIAKVAQNSGPCATNHLKLVNNH